MRNFQDALFRWSAAAVLVSAAGVPAVAAPQEVEYRRVPVRVTAVQGERAYLDVGSDAGLAVGDRVQLFPDGAPMFECVVRGVTKGSSRIDCSGANPPVIGTSGEALVPLSRSAGGVQPGAPLPWTQPAEKFDPNQPLLAPVQGPANDERERSLRGRWFLQGDWTQADSGGSQDYTFARSGLDLELQNPFGKGGALEFDGEVYRRASSLWDDGDDERTGGRIDQASLWWGGVRGNGRRVELGRFLQHEFPEFGVLDGAEVTWRTQGGDRFGASAGLLPAVDLDRSTGDDVAASLYYRLVAGEDEHGALGVGFQKTWHEGSADRDLFVLNGHWRAGQRLSLYGSAWVDLYTSSDGTKSAGAELTQAFAQATWRFENGLSVGLNASQFRWPELLRDEIPAATAATLSDGEVTRVGLSASKSLTQDFRLSVRADHWSDQDDDGGHAELRGGLRGVVFGAGELSGSLFATQGKFSDVLGLRLGVWRATSLGTWRLDAEAAEADQQDFTGSQATLLLYAVRAGWDLQLGSHTLLSLSGETRFGDEQDSQALGLFLQRRF